MARKPVRIDEIGNERYKLLSFHLPSPTTASAAAAAAATSQSSLRYGAAIPAASSRWGLALRAAANIGSAINTTELQLKLIYDDISLIKNAVMRMKPRWE